MTTGFTGTRDGMSKPQLIRVAAALAGPSLSFHHGDCIGADDEAAELAYRLGHEVHGHPPINESKRAYSIYTHVWYPAKDYHPRNHDIVDASGLVIATPKDYSPTSNSGTWATIRYAIAQKRIVWVFFPDGARMLSVNGEELKWG